MYQFDPHELIEILMALNMKRLNIGEASSQKEEPIKEPIGRPATPENDKKRKKCHEHKSRKIRTQ